MILICHGDEHVRERLSHHLADLGEVHATASWGDLTPLMTSERLKSAPACVLIYDARLPGIDPLGLFEIVKRRHPATRVVSAGTIEAESRLRRELVRDMIGDPDDHEVLAAAARRQWKRAAQSLAMHATWNEDVVHPVRPAL